MNFRIVSVLCMIAGWTVFCYAQEAPEMAWGVQFGTDARDFPLEVATDSHGNVYVVGETNGGIVGENAGGKDGFLIKYTSAGAQDWALQYGTSSTDLISGVDVYENDDVAIVGRTNGTMGAERIGSTDVIVSRVDGSGNTLWLSQFGSSKADVAARIIVDSAGNLYVSGTTSGGFDINNLGDEDAFVAKLDPDGEVLWIRQYGTSDTDKGYGIAVSPQGDVFAGGWTYGVIGNHIYGGGDPYITLFDSEGNRSWTRQFGTGNWDGIHGMAAFDDASGDVLVGGCWNWPSCYGWLRRYDREGSLKWEELIYNTASKSSCGQTVYIDDAGNCYHIGGTDDDLFQTSLGNQDAFLVKLGNASGVHERESRPQQPQDFELFQNAPNPFNPNTEIKYSLNKDSQIQLVLTNVKGEVIRTLIDQWQSAGAYSIFWDATDDSGQAVSSGIYFYILNANDRIEMKKMLLIR